MSIEKAKLALQLFEAALEVAPDNRASWVQQACLGDMDLATEVSSLLAVHDEPGDFLDQLTADVPQLEQVSDFRIAPGQNLGDFIIEEQIGAGGMGLVYRAQQISLNRPVALKVLPPHLRYSESAQTRFHREVEAAARLGHRNIVAVYTTGQDDNVIYYAMELIDGPSLSELIDELKRHPLPELRFCQIPTQQQDQSGAATHAIAADTTPPPTEKVVEKIDLGLLGLSHGYFPAVATLVADVANGLQYAHDMRVVHRDIKPSNLLLSSDGEIHISDFGLARVAQEPGLTRTGEVIGTPFYMAPEQISSLSGRVDERTDIYALGATLYELLTLRPPFWGDHRAQVISQIVHDEPIPPKTANRLVPSDLDTICLKAIEKNPRERYQSAREFAEDLLLYMEGRPILARRITPVGRTIRWVRRQPTWAIALAGLCCLAAAAVFFAYRSYVSETRWTDAQFASLSEKAQLAALEGDLERATTAISEAEQLGAPASQLLLLRGQLDLQIGEYQDACDKLELARKEMPDSLAVHALLANAYQANEERAKAAAIVSLLPTFQPVTLQDYLLLGQAQYSTDFAAALSTLDQAIQLDKTSVQARLTRGSVLVERAMDTAAASHAERALDDLRIAGELLEPNCYLLSKILSARLVAATAYELADDQDRRQRHLEEAKQVAEALQKFPAQYQSHYWRALYYDYRGDDRQALEAWRAMKDRQIAVLVLTLFRVNEVDEALKYCDERTAEFPPARSTQFFRGLLVSSKAESPAEVREAFEPHGEETLDALNAHRFHYIINCLAGDMPKAQAVSRDYRASLKVGSIFDPWRPDLLAYTCARIDEETLLERSAKSRIARCQAHFYIGVTHLALGDRDVARSHFQAAAQCRIINNLEDHTSRAFLAQLDRDPQWPKWIAER